MRTTTLVAWALAVRLAMALLIAPTAEGDGVYYLSVAASGWLSDMYRPPLYPIFLMLFGSLGAVVFAIQSALTIGVAVLTLRWTGNQWAALLIGCCPFLVVNEYAIRSEALLIPLLLLAWLLLNRKMPIAAGIGLGLAILCNDIFLLLPAFALIVGWRMGKTWRFAIMAGIAYFTLLPFAAYNAHIHDRFALSEGRAGFNLWIGTWERDPNWYLQGIHRADYPADAFRSTEERAELLAALEEGNDAAFRRVAIDRIVTEPLDTASAWVSRYWRLWLGTRTDQNETRLDRGSLPWLAFKSAMWALNLVLLLGGLWGLWKTGRWTWAIPVAYVALVYIPFHNVETRYSLPALAMLLMPLGLALPSTFPAFRRLRTSSPSDRPPSAPN